MTHTRTISTRTHALTYAQTPFQVKEAAVIAVHSQKWMERPLACVVLHAGQTLTHEELVQFLNPRMAKWWIPEAMEIVQEIPKTSVGKFSKKDLRDMFPNYTLP